MIRGLEQWVKALSERPLPVWRTTREALITLAGEHVYNGSKLTQAVAHDPLLCCQLLRAANARGAQGQIATAEQAAVMLGSEGLEQLGRRLPVLEDTLPEPALRPLRQLQRRDFHVGFLSRELVRQHRDIHYDDAFFAGFLHNLAELTLRAHSPELFLEMGALIRRDGATPANAAQRLLGFEMSALSAALARSWRLPLLLQTVLDADHGHSHRSELITLAIGLLNAGPAVWTGDLTDPLVLRLAEILSEPPPLIRRTVFTALVAAARYLADNGANADDSLTEIFPQEPEASYEDESPGPAAPRGSSTQNGRLDGDSFRRRIEQDTASRSNLAELLEYFATLLRNEIGLDRVIFALLSPDRTTLRGRFFRGVGTTEPLHGFQFENGDGSLFMRLLEAPATVWVNKGNRSRVEPMLTPAVLRTVGTVDFLAQSIFLRGRAIGLCYADKHTAGIPVTSQEYADFRQVCAMLGDKLAALSPRPPTG